MWGCNLNFIFALFGAKSFIWTFLLKDYTKVLSKEDFLCDIWGLYQQLLELDPSLFAF